MSQDPIALLLPDVGEEECADARRLTTFLRLLKSDARGEASGSAQVVLARAREDLEQDRQARLALALEELLRAHLEHDLGCDEYSWFGDSRLSVAAAWSLVEDFRAEWGWLPQVPQPGEAALSVAERVYEALERLLGKTSRTELWGARLSVVRDGTQVGGASLRALAEARGARMSTLRPELVAGVAECYLSRGAVREAGAWLASQADLFCKSPRLAQLSSWVRALLGETPQGIRGAGPLPAALCELRECAPEMAASLPGVSASRVRGERWRSLRERRSIVQREELGASVLAVFAFRGGAARAVCLEVAPALSYGTEAWLEERGNACTEPNDPQHALIVEVRACLLDDTSSSSVALGGASTKRLALEPILDDEGEVCGWLHLEFEHFAIPSRRGLRELAADWRDKLLNWTAADEAAASGSGLSRDSAGNVEARKGAFHALLESVGLKLKRRRWWGLDLVDGAAFLVAQGGEGLSPASMAEGQGRAVRRSIATSGIVRFDEARSGLAIHPEAESGVVLPIRGVNGVLGCLVVESRRRNDFPPSDLDRLAAEVPSCSTRFRLARFSDWHAKRFGVGVRLPSECSDFGEFAERIARVATAQSSLSISGPAGCGKRVVARWVVFESRTESRTSIEFSCVADEATSGLQRAFEEAAGGFLIITDLERSSSRLQQELHSLINQGRNQGHCPRVISVTRKPLGELVAGGDLRDDLALTLERTKFKLPALSDRREEIPALAQFLATQIAREEGAPALQLEDEVLALLWRQSWQGNVRELEGVVTRLVLGQSDRRVSLQLVAEAIDDGRARIPSRRPRAEDLVAALRTTRTRGGRINKTRAAAYLGWDPDTLVVRMGDAGIAEGTLPKLGSWTARETYKERPSA